YRANLWAMKELGVRRVIGPCASGSLSKDLPPGTFVVCDQFVDRTSGRADTFYDGPVTTHVSAADPYCSELRQILLETGRSQDLDVEPVSHESVVKVFTENNEKLRRLLFEAIPKIAPQPQDTCATALTGARF